MAYNFSKFNQKSKNVEEWLSKEFVGIRTSRATPTLLDAVFVEAYGSKIPIKQVASIATENPRTLRVLPYDNSQIKNTEKAITAANLGLSIASDERGVYVMFPELTTERRVSLIKLAKEKLEMAKVSLRKIRDEISSEIQDAEKRKEIGEDEKFRLKNELQKLVDVENKKLEGAVERKEKEIMV